MQTHLLQPQAPEGRANVPYRVVREHRAVAEQFHAGGVARQEHRFAEREGFVRTAYQTVVHERQIDDRVDRKSTRLNSSQLVISYAVFCLKKKDSSIH